MVKSVMVTYALWAVGGPFGLHHFYLGRDNHALLWMLTLGGFGVGWIRELLRIPTYVAVANQDPDMERRRCVMTTSPPPVNLVRVAGQVCVGIYFGTVALIGLNSLNFFDLLILPLCVGAGVHLVSTIGQQTSDLRKTLTACLITSPFFYGSTLSPLPISLAASLTATQHRKYKKAQTGNKQELGLRLCKLTLAWLVFSAPLAYCVFHNTTATLYYLSDCMAVLLDVFWFLPWLRNLVEYILLMPYRLMCVLTGGSYYEEAWKKMLEILLKDYTEREKEALKVLSLGAEASLEEITRGYRELAKIWHPDHNPSKDAEMTFVKIHEAYEVLLRRYKPRRFR
ncbi:dnaJ homolog subfamily C member 22 [Corythoichthys intestinalis]|uniref:dnaJ homolog subfamily C member 22 n=1 Tax=Corythoichthys intestinalis TaxID=161448 RepID=UPI0025A4EEF7|nr:dnaJ homolog subfamily C member 22 [Corythoichthys intestinalis]XP_061802242.1 dnaJ homolog subfamily C member 22-like [Nerophis lumbriciformis]